MMYNMSEKFIGSSYMNIVIRKANAGDIDAVSEIYEHIHTAEEQVMVLHTLVTDPAAKGTAMVRRLLSFTRNMPSNTAAIISG